MGEIAGPVQSDPDEASGERSREETFSPRCLKQPSGAWAFEHDFDPPILSYNQYNNNSDAVHRPALELPRARNVTAISPGVSRGIEPTSIGQTANGDAMRPTASLANADSALEAHAPTDL